MSSDKQRATHAAKVILAFAANAVAAMGFAANAQAVLAVAFTLLASITGSVLIAILVLELFSREKRPGWDNWGLEAEKFNEEAA